MSLFKASLVSKIILIFLQMDQNFISYFKKILKKEKIPIQKEKSEKIPIQKEKILRIS